MHSQPGDAPFPEFGDLDLGGTPQVGRGALRLQQAGALTLGTAQDLRAPRTRARTLLTAVIQQPDGPGAIGR